MNILVFNQDWFVEDWRAHGHWVITVGNSSHLNINLGTYFIDIDSILRILPEGFVPDWIMFHDNSCPLSIIGLEHCSIPMALYSVDTHHHCLLHSYMADVFDVVFVAQSDFITFFQGRRAHIEWLPLWASREIEPSEEKKHGTIFVGTMNRSLNPERVQFFEELEKITDIELIQGDYSQYFPYSRIVVNQTVKGDLNFRVFETMRCGPLLLTEASGNGLLKLFTPGEDLLLYRKGDVHEVAGILDQLKHQPEVMQRIAQTGHRKVVEQHRAEHRAATVLRTLEEVKVPVSGRQVVGLMMNYTVWAANAGLEGGIISASGFAHALKLLTIMLDRRQALNEESAFFAVVACLGFDKLTGRTSGRRMLEILVDQFPNLKTLGVGQLALLADGEERQVVEKIAEAVGLPDVSVICGIFPVR
jgi:glycosyltransferase involved in cell wall biosynthesis